MQGGGDYTHLKALAIAALSIPPPCVCVCVCVVQLAVYGWELRALVDAHTNTHILFGWN